MGPVWVVQTGTGFPISGPPITYIRTLVSSTWTCCQGTCSDGEGAVGMFLWFRWMIMDIKGFFLAMGRDIDAEIEEDNKVIDVAVRAHFNENKEAAVVDKAS